MTEQSAAERATPEILDAVGRAAHEGWKLWIVKGGYADHEFVSDPDADENYGLICTCGHQAGMHHVDYVPWERLPESKRGKYIETGMAGYAAGLAAQRDQAGRDAGLEAEDIPLIPTGASFPITVYFTDVKPLEPLPYPWEGEEVDQAGLALSREELSAARDAIADAVASMNYKPEFAAKLFAIRDRIEAWQEDR